MKKILKPLLANFGNNLPKDTSTNVSYDNAQMLNLYKGKPAVLSQLPECMAASKKTAVSRETTDDR